MEKKMRALPMQPLYEGNIGSAFLHYGLSAFYESSLSG